MRGDGTSRRRVLRAGALLGSGLVAGCTGGNDTGNGNTTGSTATEATAAGTTANASANTTSGSGSSNGPYSVSMAPMGEVPFDSVPERWVAFGSEQLFDRGRVADIVTGN